jgi:hypothetical protein
MFQAGVEAPSLSPDELMSLPVKPNPKLVVGALDNGLRYVIMPNPTPPQRFEAHLEVHVGSVDERENEQVGGQGGEAGGGTEGRGRGARGPV